MGDETTSNYVAKSEFIYGQQRKQNRNKKTDYDEEAEKLLSEYMAKGDYKNIDDDVVSVISQKIPLLNK